jgi:inhibitor of the pro-sigma K processing machinery
LLHEERGYIMAVVEISSFLITSLVGLIALIRVANDARKSICSIILNIMLGGALFIILNIMGVAITLNLITGGIIAFLGVPGVILLIILKTIFKIF